MEERSNIWVASSDGDLARVKQLIEKEGMDVNAQDDSGYSPLHAAVSYNHISLVRYLLSQGGDLKLVDQDGDTPLLACETTEMFDLLVEAGADPMATNFIGETLQQKLMEEKNDELLTHWMNFLVRKGLGADVGVTFTARAEEEKDHHHQDEEENHGI